MLPAPTESEGLISLALEHALREVTEYAESRFALAKHKAAGTPATSVPMAPPSYLAPRTSLTQDAEQLAHYRGWVYAAVGVIAKRIAGQPIRVARLSASRGRRRTGLSEHKTRTLPDFVKGLASQAEPLEQHPLLDALNDPNPMMVFWTLMFSTAAALELTGRAYWWTYRQDSRRHILPVPPSWVEPQHERGKFFSSYKIRPFGGTSEVVVPSDDVVNFFYPDPSNPLAASSPLQAQSRAVTTDESIQQAQMRAFDQGIFPSVLISVGRHPDLATPTGGAGMSRPLLTQEQRQQLIESIEQQHAGAVRAGKPIILDALIDGIHPFSSSPQEMGFRDSGELTKERIFQGFGVNPLVAGAQGSNRAEHHAALQALDDCTVNPKLMLISQCLTEWLAPMFSRPGERLLVWIEPAVSNDPELQLKRDEQLARFGGLSVNELRASHGRPPVSWGDAPIPPQFIQTGSLVGRGDGITPQTAEPAAND